MTLDELQAYIQERDTIHRDVKNGTLTERERILLRTVKMMEEMGELSEAILSELGHQRDAKLEKHTQEALNDEVADVLITLLLLAKALKVDPTTAVEKKIKKIENRTATYPF
jgi:NTP pyrophosphatase (non-canonical NTP hydrolase)